MTSLKKDARYVTCILCKNHQNHALYASIVDFTSDRRGVDIVGWYSEVVVKRGTDETRKYSYLSTDNQSLDVPLWAQAQAPDCSSFVIENNILFHITPQNLFARHIGHIKNPLPNAKFHIGINNISEAVNRGRDRLCPSFNISSFTPF